MPDFFFFSALAKEWERLQEIKTQRWVLKLLHTVYINNMEVDTFKQPDLYIIYIIFFLLSSFTAASAQKLSVSSPETPSICLLSFSVTTNAVAVQLPSHGNSEKGTESGKKIDFQHALKIPRRRCWSVI